jgi:hypothetical protein
MNVKRNIAKVIIAAICVAAGFNQINALAQQGLLLYAATGYASSTGELYILNPLDGSVIEDVGPLNDSDGNNYSLTGLRYDPSTGLLYGITIGSSPTAPNSLVVVNPNNAKVTPLGGSLGTRLSDIAIDPVTFIMYGVSGSTKYFYTVDKRAGVATRIGNTNLPPKRGGGLAADATGLLYGTNDSKLFIYDKDTGAATTIGDMNLTFFVDALAFSAAGVLYGIEGGGATADSPNGEDPDEPDPDWDDVEGNRSRWLVVIDTFTGIGVELGETVGNLSALAFVPAP